MNSINKEHPSKNKENLSKNSDVEKSYPFARWMSWFFLAISILLLIYTYHRAGITFKSARYLKYYLIFSVGILFWGIVLQLRESIQANIVTATTSLCISMYLMEGMLFFLNASQPIDRASVATKLGFEYDHRTKLEVIKDLNIQGVDAVPSVYGSRLSRVIGTTREELNHLLPLSGVSNKTTVESNESGKYLIYKSDRHGFNNPDSQWDVQSLDWLLTGDSFTHGSSVQPGEEIAGQLRSITGNSAISLGIGGNSPLIEYAALVEYGDSLTPAKVLWIYYEGNDLGTDIIRDKTSPLLMKYMQDGFSQNLINRQKEIDSMLEEYIFEEMEKAKQKSQSYKLDWVRLSAVRKMINIDDNIDVNVDDPVFAKILTNAKERINEWGGKLYFVYLPEYKRYHDMKISHDRFRKKSEVINLLKKLDIPVIDIHQEVFANHIDPISLFALRLPGHYNADGYAEVAKAIVKGVAEINPTLN
jgi:lysophospholipase L1-like esterase